MRETVVGAKEALGNVFESIKEVIKIERVEEEVEEEKQEE